MPFRGKRKFTENGGFNTEPQGDRIYSGMSQDLEGEDRKRVPIAEESFENSEELLLWKCSRSEEAGSLCEERIKQGTISRLSGLRV